MRHVCGSVVLVTDLLLCWIYWSCQRFCWLVCECGDWQTQASSVFIPVWVMVLHSLNGVLMKILTHCLEHDSVGWRKLNLILLHSLLIIQVWNSARQLTYVPGIADKQYSIVLPGFRQMFESIACLKTVMLWHAIISNMTHTIKLCIIFIV